MTDRAAAIEGPTLTTMRRVLLFILVLGVAGTVVELLLLRHTEGFSQILPVALLAASVPSLAWCLATGSAASLRTLQLLMAVFLVSGLVGVWMHYQGNVVYEVESMPGIAGMELFRRAVMGSTPTLAPGTMIQLGLVGLAYTFRHPGLAARGAGSAVSSHPPMMRL